VVIFDPYSDRMARNIRNSLSSALVKELTGNGNGAVSAVADSWLATTTAPIYRLYIDSRLVLYRQVIGEIRASRLSDPRYQAICLWNLGLFFEVHELLENLWQRSREPERSALKGWIQAAGAYVHFQRGKVDAARSLARRAEMHLRKGRRFLKFIANLDRLIEALADPTEGAPKIL
jgi:hypothetical protein